MPQVVKSIGTSSRDYSTITLWEADLDNDTPYDAGDDALGECYDDSAFDETFTLDGGGTIGLVATTLTAATGENHTGIAGTGVRIVRTGTGNVATVAATASIPRTVSWIEFNVNGQVVTIAVSLSPGSAEATVTLANCLVHDKGGGGTGVNNQFGIQIAGNSHVNVLDNILYDILSNSTTSTHVSGGIRVNSTSARLRKLLNNTLHNVRRDGTSTAGNDNMLWVGDATSNTAQNNVATDPGGSAGTMVCYSPASPASAVMDHNAASDTTASGTGSLDSITTADQFVSTVGGSEDLHLKTGADCIDAGTDLGTTPTGVNIDIDGRDRDALGDVWDIGADEFVAAAGGLSIPVAMYHRLRQMGV